MKKSCIAILCLVLFMAVSACGLADGEVSFKPGTYSGSTTGLHDTVTVDVTVSEHRIENVVVTEEHETIGYGDVAVELMPQRIVDAQSLKVDIVSGASITSYAVLRATESALKQASDDLSPLKVGPEQKEPVTGEDETFDVVIVGAGIAGLNAAYEFHYNYPEVRYILLEQLDVITGSLPGAGGAIIADKSTMHAELGQESSVEEICKILDGATGHEVNHSFAGKIYSISEEVLNRLLENGLTIKTSSLSSGARSDKVYALIAEKNGEGFAKFYYDWVKKVPINLRTHSKVTALITENGTVCGVEVEDGEKTYRIKAKAVLLTTGGFGNNKEMLEEYAPSYATYLPRTGKGADGSGFALTAALDSQVIGNGVMGPGLAANIGCKPLGGMFMVNQDGLRIGNESSAAGIAKALTENGDSVYVIVDSKYKDTVSIYPMFETLTEHVRKGYARRFDTIEDLADGMKISKENLLATVASYNAAASEGTEIEFGLKPEQATVLDSPPYYAERLVPFFFGTIPSVKIDEEMHLVNKHGEIVKGLYCAGELTEANLWDNAYPGAGVGISYATYSGAYAAKCIAGEID